MLVTDKNDVCLTIMQNKTKSPRSFTDKRKRNEIVSKIKIQLLCVMNYKKINSAFTEYYKSKKKMHTNISEMK